ncbi:ClpX C4-type zinc finger protein [Zhihengliuella somnathii]
MVASPLAAICRACATAAVGKLEEAELVEAAVTSEPPWERMSDEELLTRLPEVAAAGAQVEEHLAAWVSVTRERGVSWARIGAALGMTRQSAWERFEKSRS